MCVTKQTVVDQSRDRDKAQEALEQLRLESQREQEGLLAELSKLRHVINATVTEVWGSFD